MVDADIVTMSD